MERGRMWPFYLNSNESNNREYRVIWIAEYPRGLTGCEPTANSADILFVVLSSLFDEENA